MLDLVRAVGVHRKDVTRVIVSNIDVFPTEVHDATVRENRRVPVLVLFKGQLTNRFAVLFDAIEVADNVASADARNAHHRGGGNENRRAVGNVASFDVVDVAAHFRSDLTKRSVFKIALEVVKLQP